MTDASLSAKGFVWLVGSLCRAHQVPWDEARVLRGAPPPLNFQKVSETLGDLGLAVESHDLSAVDWPRARFPLFTFLSVPSKDEGNAKEPALIVRADASRVLYFVPASRHPRVADLTSLSTLFDGTGFSLVRTHAREGGAGGQSQSLRFGFTWFARELGRYPSIWRDVLVASLIIQIVGLSIPLFTQAVIDKVIAHHSQGTLAAIAVGLAVAVLFGAVLSWLRQYLVNHTSGRVDAALGSQVFWHLVRIPIPYFDQRPTGTLVARVHAVETVREFLSGAVITLLLDIPFLVLFLGVMIWYSWQLTIVALLLVLAVVLMSALVTPVLRHRLNQQFLLGAKNQAFLTEHVAGMETVKGLQMEQQLRSRYDALLARYVSTCVSVKQLAGTYTVTVAALEQAMTVAVLCIGALLVMQNPGFTIGMLVAFQMFASRISQPLLRLAGLWQEFQQATIAVRRLGDIMDAPCEPDEATSLRRQERAGQVEISALSFGYPDRSPIFERFAASLSRGRLTLLSGPSGSGKSTLVRLLLGFQAPGEGRIQLDGIDHRYFSTGELRRYFGVVPQETVLFSGTVYENVLAADPHADLDAVIEACRMAGIHDTISRLPRGYSTVLGERGVGLSGGQRQRLSIARALLRKPAVLLFDEATSGLDPAAAEDLAATINGLRGKVTILFIAHQKPKGLHVDELITLGGDIDSQSERVVAPLETAG